MTRFSGELALITGAGSGVGLAAARRMADEGCRVFATVEREDQIAALDGIGCHSVAVLDVTRPSDWSRVVGAAEAEFGSIDILFNNAGITWRGDIEHTGHADWDRVLLVNLTSVYLGCKAVIGGMLRAGRGAIVNNASINGIRGNVELVAYTAAKSGVVGLTRALALDHANQGIRVNCLCPAAIDTPMTREYLNLLADPQSAESAIAAKHPIGRMATAEEVAAVAVFLASDEASYLTGLAIPVDGGRSIR